MQPGRQFDSLFHASPQEFAPGDVIRPAEQVGASNFGRNGDRAFATADLRDAHTYADSFRERGLNPRVYRVEPLDHSDLVTANVGLRRRDGFTNVASPSGFRVVGEAPAPRTQSNARPASNADYIGQVRRRLMANPADQAARGESLRLRRPPPVVNDLLI